MTTFSWTRYSHLRSVSQKCMVSTLYTLSYNDYLQLDKILSSQECQSEVHGKYWYTLPYNDYLQLDKILLSQECQSEVLGKYTVHPVL